MTDTPGLGTLDWQPAVHHPELLAPPVRAAVVGLEAWVAPIDPAVADTAAFCDRYGVGMDVSANCVVVEGRRGQTVTYAACMVLATDRIDVNKTVRKHLDVAKLSFAPMDTATSLTAMEYGGITSIGLPPEWPVLVDSRVAETSWVVVGSGVRASKVAIAGASLLSLPGAQQLSLTKTA